MLYFLVLQVNLEASIAWWNIFWYCELIIPVAQSWHFADHLHYRLKIPICWMVENSKLFIPQEKFSGLGSFIIWKLNCCYCNLYPYLKMERKIMGNVCAFSLSVFLELIPHLTETSVCEHCFWLGVNFHEARVLIDWLWSDPSAPLVTHPWRLGWTGIYNCANYSQVLF